MPNTARRSKHAKHAKHMPNRSILPYLAGQDAAIDKLPLPCSLLRAMHSAHVSWETRMAAAASSKATESSRGAA